VVAEPKQCRKYLEP